MANKALLMELKEVIRTHQDRWNQSSWADGGTNPDATTYEDCNTSFCAAGWTAVINGYKPVADPVIYKFEDEPDFYASSLFVPRNAEARRGHPNFKETLTANVEKLGREILELNPYEADCLFLRSSSMKNFEAFATLIDAIADNRLDEWLATTSYDGFAY